MLLEVADSSMTYRARYFETLQAAPVLEINSKLGCMTIVAAKIKGDDIDASARTISAKLGSITSNASTWSRSSADGSRAAEVSRPQPSG